MIISKFQGKSIVEENNNNDDDDDDNTYVNACMYIHK
jgi:hypothetical protein